MKRPDWGAYLEGAMEEAQRARLEALLASSESARRELDGFRAFRAKVLENAGAEDVPVERLERSLEQILRASGKSRRRSRLRLALSAAAAILIALWGGYRLFLYDPMRINLSPTAERIETADPQFAMRWVRDRTSFDVPVVLLGGKAKMAGARYGEGWACYDYVVDGQEFFLYMSPSGDPLRNGERAELDGCPVYRGQGIGWEAGRYAYYLRGGDEGTRTELAKQALEETGAAAG